MGEELITHLGTEYYEEGVTMRIAVGSLVIPRPRSTSDSTLGGPGGQHANKSETAVTLRLDIAASSLPEEIARACNTGWVMWWKRLPLTPGRNGGTVR